MDPEQAAGIAEQLLALGRHRDPAAAALQQAGVEEGLQPLDLERHGGLGEVELVRGAGDAAEFDDGDEGAQGGDVEVAGHGDRRRRGCGGKNSAEESRARTGNRTRPTILGQAARPGNPIHERWQ